MNTTVISEPPIKRGVSFRVRIHMALGIRIYTIKDFIRETQSGNIDFNRSVEIIRELAAVSLSHPDHNILVDLRDTTVSGATMADIFEIVLEFMSQMGNFKNKIANVIPDEEKRISLAKIFEACLIVKDYQYKVFTDFEEAIEWLSEIENLGLS